MSFQQLYQEQSYLRNQIRTCHIMLNDIKNLKSCNGIMQENKMNLAESTKNLLNTFKEVDYFIDQCKTYSRAMFNHNKVLAVYSLVSEKILIHFGAKISTVKVLLRKKCTSCVTSNQADSTKCANFAFTIQKAQPNSLVPNPQTHINMVTTNTEINRNATHCLILDRIEEFHSFEDYVLAQIVEGYGKIESIRCDPKEPGSHLFEIALLCIEFTPSIPSALAFTDWLIKEAHTRSSRDLLFFKTTNTFLFVYSPEMLSTPLNETIDRHYIMERISRDKEEATQHNKNNNQTLYTDNKSSNDEHQQIRKSLMSDKAILQHMKKKTVIIEPFTLENLSTSSYDVTLGKYYFREAQPEPGQTIYNPYSESMVKKVWGIAKEAERAGDWIARNATSSLENIHEDDFIIWIGPGETILGHTNEFIGGRETVTTMMKTRSSMGRNFISVCKCAGWGDIGYVNRWTFEITNMSRSYSIPLVVGRRIAQIVFFDTDGSVKINDKSYSSYEQKGKYQTTNDFDQLKETWNPNAMLPKMYKDREIYHIKPQNL